MAHVYVSVRFCPVLFLLRGHEEPAKSLDIFLRVLVLCSPGFSFLGSGSCRGKLWFPQCCCPLVSSPARGSARVQPPGCVVS